jgi:hypothetical protein
VTDQRAHLAEPLATGFTGERFVLHVYVPVKRNTRVKKVYGEKKTVAATRRGSIRTRRVDGGPTEQKHRTKHGPKRVEEN